ncbi:MAG: amidase [Actinomycetota bacterium]|nr:amidase [Actinomycetota bacterium]
MEVTEGVLGLIEQHQPVVNAYCLVDAERAMADATASDDRYRRHEARGRLEGVPVAVKDVFLTAGWPTRRGSRLVDPAGPWNVDAPAVAALRRQGAVLVGKTTTPELGWKGVTDSPLHGVTRNPWDPARTAGGSSGGSAAAVVLGMATLALGTDGGGSIRIPAGFCGHVGFKPSYGRVPLWPASPFGTLAHAGPMTRTVADTALMLTVIAAPDSRDWTALPPDHTDYASALAGGVQGLRVAYSPDLGYVSVDPEIAAAVAKVAATLEQLGAAVDQVDPGFDDPVEAFHTLWFASAADATRGYSPEQRQLLDPGLAEVTAEAAAISLPEYLTAARQRVELGIMMGRFHDRYDLLLTPTLPIPAFAAGHEVPDGWPHPRWTSWTPFTYPFNLTQQPAISIPCGFTSARLPVGVQLVGARHQDALVLRAAQTLEQAL